MNRARRIISISGFIGLVIGLIIVLTFLTTERTAPASAANSKGGSDGGATPTFTTTSTPTPVGTCTGAFYEVNSPVSGMQVSLHNVSAVSANDIWAVGYSYPSPISLHYNGSSWSSIPVPAAVTSSLNGVAAISATDAWAVGTKIIRWNGTQWSVYQSISEHLEDIDALNANDIWAVGQYVGVVGQSLLMHWNGTQWTTFPNPDMGDQFNIVRDVTVLSADNAWAVGNYYDDVLGSLQPLIMHWDGTAWSLVSAPSTPDKGGLYGIDALAPNDIWAIGAYCDSDCGPMEHTLAMHWDGSAWSIVPSPDPGPTVTFSDVTMVAHDDVWAVGSHTVETGPPPYPSAVFVLHWNGSTWEIVPTPDPLRAGFDGITSIDSNNLWAVGGRGSQGGGSQTLVEHYISNCPTTTATSTATNTATASPTLTGTPPASTPSITPTRSPTGGCVRILKPGESVPSTCVPSPTFTLTLTPTPTGTEIPTITPTFTVCPIEFSDVPSDHTFYANIRCLACRGIISGYPDGTFRPGNNVTRGQIAKIVSLTTGWSEPVTGQTFEDVPEGSTFWSYVERMVLHEVMSGYPCGNPEPCMPPDSKSYFRPNASATRGQLAKIVSNAGGFTEPPIVQTFEDAAPDSTFYLFIERLVYRSAMSGYPCGNPEPCVPPDNRPYFRPGNPVTRGQAAKIVANTFYPSCETPFR